MKPYLLIFLLGLSARGAVFTSDGSDSDTQSNWNSSSDADEITIPAGTFHWNSQVTLSGRGAWLHGAGGGWAKGSSTTSLAIAGSGTKTFTVESGLGFMNGESIRAVQKSDGASKWMQGTVSSYSGTTLQIAVTSSSGSGTYAQWNFVQPGQTIIIHDAGSSILDIIEDASHSVRVSDIDFIGGTGAHEFVTTSGNGKPWVVQRCRFEMKNSSNHNGFILDTTNGLVDHVYFDTGFAWPTSGSFTGPNTCQFLRMPSVTQTTWTQTTPFGNLDANGDKMLYIESGWWQGAFTEAIDIDGGSRVVLRHNHFDNCGLTSHGQDTGNYGLRWVEFYNNVFLFDDMSGSTHRTAPMDYMFFMRGGTGIFASNTIPDMTSSDYGNKAELKWIIENLRRAGGPYACWGGGYPAPRQVGMGRVDGSGITDGTWGYRGDSEPIYLWANTGGGNYNSPTLADYAPDQCGGPGVGGFIQSGRDYFTSTAHPSWVPLAFPHPLAATTDTTPPQIASATIGSSGTTLTLALTESVSFGAGGNTGFTVSLSGGAATVTYSSGSGTATLVYTISRTIQQTETGNMAYTQPGNGVQDSVGNDLVTFSGFTITNNSTQNPVSTVGAATALRVTTGVLKIP